MTIAIVDTSWQGSYPIDFIVWDCDYPNQRRDTTQAIFSITNDNRPVITSANSVNFQENACSVLYDTETSDPNDSEGAGLTYALAGGADETRFAIDAVTGILSWANGFSPDFEAPADANADNQYEVNIQVTNSNNLTDILALTVTITNQAVEPFAAQINGGVSLLCVTGNVNLTASGGIHLCLEHQCNHRYHNRQHCWNLYRDCDKHGHLHCNGLYRHCSATEHYCCGQ